MEHRLAANDRHLSTKRLFLASANPGKLREFREAAQARGILVEPVPSLHDLPPCPEDGRTFAENARKKAIHYSQFAPGLTFADDSGISVDALGGAPGVYSARFAGPRASDQENNQKLLAELRRVPGAERSAHYVCAIALAERGIIRTLVEGRAHGLVHNEPRGQRGFGYDPLFLYLPLGKTFAEITAEEKFAVSHRGAAFRSLLVYLQENSRSR